MPFSYASPMDYRPGFQVFPHFRQVIFTFPLPIIPPNIPTGPSNTAPTAAFPTPNPFFPAVI
jgi:hypothetical protein